MSVSFGLTRSPRGANHHRGIWHGISWVPVVAAEGGLAAIIRSMGRLCMKLCALVDNSGSIVLLAEQFHGLCEVSEGPGKVRVVAIGAGGGQLPVHRDCFLSRC